MTFAFLIVAAAHAGSSEAAWDRMDPYRNLARIAEVTEPHHWYEMDGCTVGVPVSDPDGPMRRRCPATAIEERRGERRRARRGPRHRDWLGTWREVRVHEDLMLPDRARDGTRMGSFAAVIYAWTEDGLRLEALEHGGHGVLLPTMQGYDLSASTWLDWRAPDGIEGTSVLHDEAALATLTAATLDALQRLEAGESLPTGPDAMPDFPEGALPDTRFGVVWTIGIYPRGGPAPWSEPSRHWVIELPVDQLDGITQRHHELPELGLTVDVELDLPGGEVRLRAVGAAGDEVTKTAGLYLPLWTHGGNTALRDAPRLDEDAGELITVSAPSGSPWREIDLNMQSLRAADSPYSDERNGGDAP